MVNLAGRCPRTVGTSLVLLATMLGAGVMADDGAGGRRPSVDFRGEIRPILSDTCFDCHGPDPRARKGGLRLDVASGGIFAERDGERLVSPGKPGESELIRRLTSTDPEERMPPPKHGRQLKPAEIERLTLWVAEGARWQDHWSFTPLVRPDQPAVGRPSWIRNGIDAFILAGLEKEGMSPSSEADRTTLIRRVTLDLTGLPPTPAEVVAFLADRSPAAYESLVERLLGSPRYGERMAVDWLDAARYADSNGYQVDREREMWPWRDWVVDAFNRNVPFDRFSVEQIAGDLLPNPTRPQRIATGLHRNNMLNEEGGIIPEEFLAEYVADRAETTSTVWLGLTMGCARCHDHKYDPLTQKDFYSLVAFFHNVPEKGVGDFGAVPKFSAPPLLALPTASEQARLDGLAATIAKLEKELAVVPKVPAEGGKAGAERKALEGRLAALKAERVELERRVPTLMVMSESPMPRETTVLIRGQYDKKGEKVGPGTPASLPRMPADAPRNRLGLARWLVDPGNPLTPRVTVNRHWQALFGAGLVRTPEDFGSQGQAPTHPGLLDWLAGEFIRSGWDVKALHRLLVTSATYRQSSRTTPERLERDPENRLLGRSPRLRLPAEMIRDQALAVSGLLVASIGGPPVRPYHPTGLYEQIVYQGGKAYVQGHGADLYRRSLYTFWKRSVPHPAMRNFDAPFRETCVVRRARTSTPLQALNLMNDPTYVEAARFLGQRMILEGGTAPAGRIDHGFRLVVARSPLPAERDLLAAALGQALADFRADRAAADALLRVGERPPSPGLDVPELASYATVAGMLLNLDETITKE